MTTQALARSNDPLTSHLAADKVNVNYLEKLILLALSTHGPLVVSEIARCVDKPRDHISPRMKSLGESKFIFNTGKTRVPMRFGLEEERLLSKIKARRQPQQVWCVHAAGTELVKGDAFLLLREVKIDPAPDAYLVEVSNGAKTVWTSPGDAEEDAQGWRINGKEIVIVPLYRKS